MSIDFYDFSIGICLKRLAVLKSLIQKGGEFAEAKGFNQANLLNSRLAPNMLALSNQVQIACDMSKGAVFRLTGTEAPKFADDETTFEQLIDRIDRTVAYVTSVDRSAFDGSEDKMVDFKAGPMELTLKGSDYVTQLVLPNVFFHVTTAYNILRHNGVELGKFDFLGVDPSKL
ncbi:MAG: hypothetical protein ACI91G_000939 [Gammaproteobacteria bacterium]|jgi:hypothetical protein